MNPIRHVSFSRYFRPMMSSTHPSSVQPAQKSDAALSELVTYARRHAPYYAAALSHLPEHGWQLADLPLLDTTQFWQTGDDLNAWQAMTGPLGNAYVFRSGGSTGKSKFSICTREEWHRICASYGAAIATRLAAGDRVANLFFSGNLYASHLFIHASLSHVTLPITEFPFAGATPIPALVEGLREHQINVLAVVPAHLMQIADYLAEQGQTLPAVTRILYGGDSLFADQLPLLARVFPHAQCASIGYASVEVGALGASLPDCVNGEHRVLDGEAILEIVDEDSSQVIDEPGHVGLLVATSLARRLTPLIRCPTGDLATWCEAPGPARKFALRGRSRLGHQIRIGYAFLVPDMIERCIAQTLQGQARWQLVLSREEGVDVIRLCIDHAGNEQVASQLMQALLHAHAGMEEIIALRQASWDIVWSMPSSMLLDERTGKLRRIVDRRHQVAGEDGR